MFSVDTYVQRRVQLGKIVSKGLIILPANNEVGMNYTNNLYPFRQDSNVLYYTGINRPDIVVVIDLEQQITTVYGKEATIDDIVWTGKIETLQEAAAKAGITKVENIDKLPALIKAAQQKALPIHFTPPYRWAITVMISTLLNIPVQQVKEASSVTLIKAIVQQRSIKEEQEIEEIEKAVNVSNKMHLTAIRLGRAGVSEHYVASVVQQVAQQEGGQLAFPVILTANGQYLHNHVSNHILKDGEIVICDAGASTPMGYAGDLTRTFPVSGKFTALQKNMYNIVLEAEQKGIEAVKPGVRFLDVYNLSSRVLVDGLIAEGLMQGNPEEAVQAGAHTLFFQCGLGHMMGLDVHDMENLGEEYVGYTDVLKKSTEFGLKSLRLGKELEAGYVLTVEPGLYFIPELIDMWAAEKKLNQFIKYDKLSHLKTFGGIRIEEDVLVTREGYKILGDPLIKSAEDVEASCAQ